MTPPKRPNTPARQAWATTPNDSRGRPMKMITMSPEGWAELDRRRALVMPGDTPLSRGAYIETLLYMTGPQNKSKKSTRKA